MPRKILPLLLLFLTLTLAACQSTPTPEPTPLPPAPQTLTDALGRDLTFTQPYQRIASIAPSNTEILFALGAGPLVVARDQFSDYPAEALSLPDLGSGFGGYNTEILLSLQPDLVLAADITAPEQIKILEDLGLTVYALPNPTSFDGLYANLRIVGLLTGRIAAADALAAQLQARVKAVQLEVAARSYMPLVFYEIDASADANAPWTSGAGTFVDLLITTAGGRNIAADLSGWAQLSLETLLTENPDLILLGDYTYGGVTPEMVAARPGWEGLQAVQDGRVFTFDDNLVSRPGPRLVDGLEAMARLFVAPTP